MCQVFGLLLQFRDYYLEQRRLQVTSDLAPPHNFLETYQSYLSQESPYSSWRKTHIHAHMHKSKLLLRSISIAYDHFAEINTHIRFFTADKLWPPADVE
jgi:hypothetical protein